MDNYLFLPDSANPVVYKDKRRVKYIFEELKSAVVEKKEQKIEEKMKSHEVKKDPVQDKFLKRPENKESIEEEKSCNQGVMQIKHSGEVQNQQSQDFGNENKGKFHYKSVQADSKAFFEP